MPVWNSVSFCTRAHARMHTHSLTWWMILSFLHFSSSHCAEKPLQCWDFCSISPPNPHLVLLLYSPTSTSSILDRLTLTDWLPLNTLKWVSSIAALNCDLLLSAFEKLMLLTSHPLFSSGLDFSSATHTSLLEQLLKTISSVTRSTCAVWSCHLIPESAMLHSFSVPLENYRNNTVINFTKSNKSMLFLDAVQHYSWFRKKSISSKLHVLKIHG